MRAPVIEGVDPRIVLVNPRRSGAYFLAEVAHVVVRSIVDDVREAFTTCHREHHLRLFSSMLPRCLAQ
jgi:hypothetical protein